MTPLGLERFGCLLRHSGGSRPQNTQEHEKHHEAEGLSHTGCSGYWAGIHEHRLIVLVCHIVYIPRAVGKHASQKVITLPCVGLSSLMHRALRRRSPCCFALRRFHSTLFGAPLTGWEVRPGSSPNK